MCLTNVRKPKQDEMSGIGYKLVRVTDVPGEYKPEWEYFSLMGLGGCIDKVGRKNEVVKTSVTYKLNRTYKVKHKRKVCKYNHNNKPIPGEYYPAGVHLWLSGYDYQSSTLMNQFNFKLVEFSYKNAVAVGMDGRLKAVVAMQVTPIREIK